ncbi:MAG: hypothetical protein J0L84_02025 [Verrucomicrobia bacterium]|nr:hypothetical protein [Verrucomicrobiota bacterium]
MPPLRSLLIAAGSLFLTASSLRACLWDVDTLQMERKRFPGVNELITGNFVRHGPDYYQWRIDDRRRRLQDSPGDPALVDDLAVALDKLGRPKEGIALVSDILRVHPNRYETVANLGTLHIHAGDLDQGARLIAEAIRINPDAHFGRERFQRLFVRYLQQSEMVDKGVLSAETRWQRYQPVGFARFVLELPGIPLDAEARDRELDAALKGILGIMHFGNFESPGVLEALGDLLLRTGEGDSDARLLAGRAYLKARRGAQRPEAAAFYDQMIGDALSPNADFHGTRREKAQAQLNRALDKDLAAADQRHQEIVRDEQQWIREGGDVDRLFAAKYYASLEDTMDAARDSVAAERPDERTRSSFYRAGQVRMIAWAAAMFLGLLTLTATLITASRRRRRRLQAGGCPRVLSP